MKTIVLLGDSVFDNGVYVPGQPDVVTQLKSHLPEGWDAVLRARDGAVIRDVKWQTRDLPKTAAHLVVSVGGNDGLLQIHDLLSQPLRILGKIAKVREQLEADYKAMLNAIEDVDLPITVCTVYSGDFPDLKRRVLAKYGTRLISEGIEAEAKERGHGVLDLRTIFTRKEDYTNIYEPSAIGGDRLARAIATVVAYHTAATEVSDERARYVMGL